MSYEDSYGFLTKMVSKREKRKRKAYIKEKEKRENRQGGKAPWDRSTKKQINRSIINKFKRKFKRN